MEATNHIPKPPKGDRGNTLKAGRETELGKSLGCGPNLSALKGEGFLRAGRRLAYIYIVFININ